MTLLSSTFRGYRLSQTKTLLYQYREFSGIWSTKIQFDSFQTRKLANLGGVGYRTTTKNIVANLDLDPGLRHKISSKTAAWMTSSWAGKSYWGWQ